MGNANDSKGAGGPRTTMAFRDDLLQRRRLEVIQAAKGHSELSDTLREAVAEYIDRNADLLNGKTDE